MLAILHSLGMFVADSFKSRCRLVAENLVGSKKLVRGRSARRPAEGFVPDNVKQAGDRAEPRGPALGCCFSLFRFPDPHLPRLRHQEEGGPVAHPGHPYRLGTRVAETPS